MGFTLQNLFTAIGGLIHLPEVQQIADSPELKALAFKRVMEQAAHTLPGIISDEVAHGDPDRSEQAVIDDMDGRIWHNARKDLSDYYVTELRNDAAYDGPLRGLIRQALTTAAETHNAPPPTEPGLTAAGGVTQDAPSFAFGALPPDGASTPLGYVVPESTDAVIAPPAEQDDAPPQTFDR